MELFAAACAAQADQLRALERTRLHALVDADTATARGLMAGDFQAIPPTGDPLGREDYLGGSAEPASHYPLAGNVADVYSSPSAARGSP